MANGSEMQGMLSGLLQPLMQQYMKSQGLEPGAFSPSGNHQVWRNEQDFIKAKERATQQAVAGDPEPLKLIRGLYSMLGQDFGDRDPQQLKDLESSYKAISPLLRGLAPGVFDAISGQFGSPAGLTDAIMDVHRYEKMPPTVAAQVAEGIKSELLTDPKLKMKNFKWSQIGEIYKQAVKSGQIPRGASVSEIADMMPQLTSIVSSAQQALKQQGYATNDIEGIWKVVEQQRLLPKNRYRTLGEVTSDIDTSFQAGQRGGWMSQLGQGQQYAGGVGLQQQEREHAQLMSQARNSKMGKMVAATSKALADGLITTGSVAAQFLKQVDLGKVPDIYIPQWQAMMARSGAEMDGRLAYSMLNDPSNMSQMTQNRTAAVRAAQGRLDFGPRIAAINKMYPGTGKRDANFRSSALEHMARGPGRYESYGHFQQLQGPQMQRLHGLTQQMQDLGANQSRMAGTGWQGLPARAIEMVKGVRHPSQSPTLGKAVGIGMGGVEQSAMPTGMTPEQPYQKTPALPKPAVNPVNTTMPGSSLPPIPGPMSIPKLAAALPDCLKKKVASVKTAAPRGLPDREDFGDFDKVTPGIMDMFVQRHRAHRAGEHFDYRFGTPETGLYSWSMKPPRLPKPGEKRFVRQQPIHTHQYGSFQGSLGTGYGAGTVRQEQKGKILITAATPDKIEFTTASTGTPERFVLLKPKTWGAREWLLINNTPNKPAEIEKTHYKKIPAEAVEPFLDKMQAGDSVQAKLDGASSLIKLMRNGAEVLSYRTSKKTGRPIVHTEKFFGGRPKFEVPKDLVGTVLKGELYGEHSSVPRTSDRSDNGLRSGAIGSGGGEAARGSDIPLAERGDAQATSAGYGAGGGAGSVTQHVAGRIGRTTPSGQGDISIERTGNAGDTDGATSSTGGHGDKRASSECGDTGRGDASEHIAKSGAGVNRPNSEGHNERTGRPVYSGGGRGASAAHAQLNDGNNVSGHGGSSSNATRERVTARDDKCGERLHKSASTRGRILTWDNASDSNRSGAARPAGRYSTCGPTVSRGSVRLSDNGSGSDGSVRIGASGLWYKSGGDGGTVRGRDDEADEGHELRPTTEGVSKDDKSSNHTISRLSGSRSRNDRHSGLRSKSGGDGGTVRGRDDEADGGYELRPTTEGVGDVTRSIFTSGRTTKLANTADVCRGSSAFDRIFHDKWDDSTHTGTGSRTKSGADGVIPPGELGGLLNATIEGSLSRQRDRGINIKNMLYDIQQRGKEPIDPNKVPYAERRKMLEEILKILPQDKFHLAEEETEPEKAKQLWRDILAKKHPMTREGVVIHPATGRPIKAKPLEEADVHITDIFPGRGRLRGRMSGGFGYSLKPGTSRVGEVGTGLSDTLRRQLHTDPTSFIGRVARVRSQGAYPSEALRAPSLIALHEDL